MRVCCKGQTVQICKGKVLPSFGSRAEIECNNVIIEKNYGKLLSLRRVRSLYKSDGFRGS